jgi:hypothetical protein
MDAMRVEDDTMVVLKRIPAASEELRIALHLSSDKMCSDPRNRIAHVLDTIILPDDKESALIVVPYLRRFDSPPFHCCSEFIEALRQFIQVHIYFCF